MLFVSALSFKRSICKNCESGVINGCVVLGTRTGAALRHLYYNSLNSAQNRENAPDVLVVITDGRSTDRVAIPSYMIKSVKNIKVCFGIKFMFVKHFQIFSVYAYGPTLLTIYYTILYILLQSCKSREFYRYLQF